MWRLCLVAAVGSVLAGVVGHLSEGVRSFVVAPVGIAAWCAVARMLLLDSSLRRTWKWSLLAGAGLVVVSGANPVGRVLLSVLTFAFLLLRRYRVYQHLGSRRRAALFGLGLVSFVALVSSPGPADDRGWLPGLAHHAAGYARFALITFWVFTLLHLFIGIRLHFLRLRPKLAISALLVAALPVSLLLLLAGVGIWGALGGARSTQGRAVLQDWLQLVASDALESRGPFGPGFGAVGLGPGETELSPPWREDVGNALSMSRYDSMPPAIWLRQEGELWALRTPMVDGRPSLAGARKVSLETVARLAALLHAEVTLVTDGSGDWTLGAGGLSPADGDTLGSLCVRPDGTVAPQPGSEDLPLTDRWLLFGGAPIEVWELERGQLERATIVLNLRLRLSDLGREFLSQDNEINLAVTIAMIAVAVLFLIFGAFALYFGVRIVGGITNAVRRLHQATERVSRGDLDTWIELPNEDEFGDLASSFNEMTAAIRLGQEQVVARQRLEQEVSMARQIQERLLPHEMPRVAGFEVSGSSEPSRRVGGDYFDFLPLPDGRWGVAVGDVTGKGIPAALLMSNLQATLQGQAIHPGRVCEQVRRMNDLLAASTDPHMFATFFYGVLDPDAGTMTSVNAGHEPPLLLRRDGRLERLRAGGLILGMIAGQSYEESTVQLEPGDVLVLYTDGITEAIGPRAEGLRPELQVGVGAAQGALPPAPLEPEASNDEDDDLVDENFFEEDRLIAAVRANLDQSADRIRVAVLDAVRRFTAGIPQSDDITLVVIKRTAAIAARGDA